MSRSRALTSINITIIPSLGHSNPDLVCTADSGSHGRTVYAKNIG